jgi:3-oxoacyl-[acyl-carrier protein] reductase
VESQVERAVEEIYAEAGGIDVLVNNAAVLRDQALVSRLRGRTRKHSLGDWDETLGSNLTGAFLVAREVAARMVDSKRPGLIVNVSSISRAGNPGQSAYAASKAALDALTVTWSQELAPYGVRVVAIAPGFVETPMTRLIPPLFLAALKERTPLKRFGRLEEFAHALRFVIENDYLNGKVLELDGGLRF